ncbi:WW domain binding protein 11-domain-containing protein [Lophiotrema nucula]|uniref:WW domain binding protein 11-domain-containing protein n=1 Tax=Lophiotrema nucula TaxID=690887 RepID=A0A6A5ZB42_9PLEO|nr:WW domain binding protein 11-domain-containing protein [Lophiotrema nucula]
MAKEKNYNPVQEAKKQEKAKQLKKQKATVQAQRTEKLARRNPNRIQRDIESLRQAAESGDIRPHERQRLQQLEKDLAAVNKAREALGEKAPQFRPQYEDRGDRGGRGGSRGRGRGGVLGKRGRDGERLHEESSDTDDDVGDIPMPRDTPPPIPHRKRGRDEPEAPQPEPKKAQIVYESAPVVRDLRKEAAKFVPAAVAQKLKLAKGQVEGRLLEPEEYERLEQEGYMKPAKSASPDVVKPPRTAQELELEAFLAANTDTAIEQAAEAAVEEAQHEMMAEEGKGKLETVENEGNVAERKLNQVEIEEVEDEDL